MAKWNDTQVVVPGAVATGWIPFSVVPAGTLLYVEELLLSYNGAVVPAAGAAEWGFGYADDAIGTNYNGLFVAAPSERIQDRLIWTQRHGFVIPATKRPIAFLQATAGTMPTLLFGSISGYRQ